MGNLLSALQGILAIVLVLLVVIQVRGGAVARGVVTGVTRRGVEALVFKGTFIVSSLFIIVSFLQLFI